MTRPMRLRVRSFWLKGHQNNDLELPSPELKDAFRAERHMGLILLRLRWGHFTYELKVNQDDELDLVKTTWRAWS